MILLDPDLDPDPSPALCRGKALSRDKNAKSAHALHTPTCTLSHPGHGSRSDFAARYPSCSPQTPHNADSIAAFEAKIRPRTCSHSPRISHHPDRRRSPVISPSACQQRSFRRRSRATPLRLKSRCSSFMACLHLAGYDHETDSGQMARRERTLRTRLRLPGGLIERTSIAKASLPNPSRQSASKRRRA